MLDLLNTALIGPLRDMGGSPAFLVEVIIGGLAAGLMYSLVALGFVLIYKASGVFNFAQGVMVLFAALTLVGQTRDLPMDVRVEVGPDTLRASSSFSIKQTDFGIKPYSGGPAGTVKVSNRVRFEIQAVAYVGRGQRGRRATPKRRPGNRRAR